MTKQELVSEHLFINTDVGPKYDRAYSLAPPVDLNDPFVFTQGQPWEAFAKMREEAPVCWQSVEYSKEPMPGYWNLTRYEDIVEVSRNTQVFSSQKGGILMGDARDEFQIHPVFRHANYDNMICMDGGMHMHVRKGHGNYFTPSYVQKLRQRVAGQVTELLDKMAAKGKCNLVKEVSEHLPMFTIAELLGVPDEDRDKLVEWVNYLEMAQYLVVVGAEQAAKELEPNFFENFMAAVQEMFEYGRHQMKNRRKSRKDDLMSDIAWLELENSLLRDEYLDGSWLLIVFAGNDTTRNSLSGTMKLLTENPEQRRMVMDDFDLIPNMCEEAIRLISPVMYMRRTATCDTELSGQKIAEGEKAVVWYGAGNRDPRVFKDPDSFDVRRENAGRHIAFGHGRHICLGMRIASMQLQEAYKQILQRFPDIRWTGEMEIAPSNFVHGIRNLEVEFTPEKESA